MFMFICVCVCTRPSSLLYVFKMFSLGMKSTLSCRIVFHLNIQPIGDDDDAAAVRQFEGGIT